MIQRLELIDLALTWAMGSHGQHTGLQSNEIDFRTAVQFATFYAEAYDTGNEANMREAWNRRQWMN